MASVSDVARYILDRLVPEGKSLTAWKIQKLVYYCQAWSLTWDEKPLFDERIEAWADGPVCPDLYAKHRGKIHIKATDIEGDVSVFDDEKRATMDTVIEYYGGKTGRYLKDLTHMERPWIDARGDTPPGHASDIEIPRDAMAEYYGGL